MKKMKDYLRKVTAGLLLVAMSSGSVGVNTVSAATDDDNDPSTTTDIIPEAVERGTLSIQIDNAGGSIVVTTQSSDGKENTQTIRKENDKTTITDAILKQHPVTDKIEKTIPLQVASSREKAVITAPNETQKPFFESKETLPVGQLSIFDYM